MTNREPMPIDGLPGEVRAEIRRLRTEAGRYRTERNQARDDLTTVTAKFEALAPALAEAVQKLNENGL